MSLPSAGSAARAPRASHTRAGVNKALPFYHFGSKAELYDEVVRRALGRLGEFMADALVAPTPRERLGSFVHRLFAYLAVQSQLAAPDRPRS